MQFSQFSPSHMCLTPCWLSPFSFSNSSVRLVIRCPWHISCSIETLLSRFFQWVIFFRNLTLSFSACWLSLFSLSWITLLPFISWLSPQRLALVKSLLHSQPLGLLLSPYCWDCTVNLILYFKILIKIKIKTENWRSQNGFWRVWIWNYFEYCSWLIV